MKIISLFFLLAINFSAVANEQTLDISGDEQIKELIMQNEEVQWKGCMAIDSNYQPYWGRTAEEALRNCRYQSQIGDCKISRCK